jgi:hypothetical protein
MVLEKDSEGPLKMWFGLGSLPVESRAEAREYLLWLADEAMQAATALQAGDQATTNQRIDDLRLASIPDGFDEGLASYKTVTATLNNALAELNREEPSWWQAWNGTPPKQVDAFVQAANAIAIRLKNRAASSDFDKPALTASEQTDRGILPGTYSGGTITGADADALARAEAEWKKKVEEDQQNACKNACNPLTLFTGEMTFKKLWFGENGCKACVPDPVKYATYAVGALVAWKLFRWFKR